MNIEQTCKITLTPEEVREALTAYIREQCLYRSNFRKYDEVVSYRMADAVENGPITVLWGEAVEEVKTPTAPPVPAPFDPSGAPTPGVPTGPLPTEPAF